MTNKPRKMPRSPEWVRELSSQQAHAILGHLFKQQFETDPTSGQEWLWDTLVHELEQRRRDCVSEWLMCSCRYCSPPFDYEMAD